MSANFLESTRRAFGLLGRQSRLLVLLGLLLALPAVLYVGSIPFKPLELRHHAPYEAPGAQAVLGADELGRSVAGRTLMAGALSMGVALIAALIAWSLAVVLGIVAGWRSNSLLSNAITYVLDLLQTIPFIVLTVAISAVVRPGILGIGVIMGVIASAAPARIVAAEVAKLHSARHVTAQNAFGHPPFLIFRTTYLPQVAFPPALWLLLVLPELLTVDAGLSFFALGAQPPTPSLGRMIFDGLNQAQAGWWLPVAPLSVLCLLVVLCHFTAAFVRRSLSQSE